MCISGTDLLRQFTCCHTEIEVADQTLHLTQSQYTDTGPTSPSTDPTTPGAWQGGHWNANFLSHWYDSTPEKSRSKRDWNPGSSAPEADALTTSPTRPSKERGEEKGSGRCSSLRSRERSVFNQTNNGAVSVASRGRLLTDEEERVWVVPALRCFLKRKLEAGPWKLEVGRWERYDALIYSNGDNTNAQWKTTSFDLVATASASRAEDPWFRSRLGRDFSGVESYQ